MTLTKDTIAGTIHESLKYSKARSMVLLESTLEIIKEALESGEDVLISDFGKFTAKTKNQRKGRNPATGEELVLDENREMSVR